MSDQIPHVAIYAAATFMLNGDHNSDTAWDDTEPGERDSYISVAREALEGALPSLTQSIRKEVLVEVETAMFSDAKINGDFSFLDILMGGEHGSEEVQVLREAWTPLLATLTEEGDEGSGAPLGEARCTCSQYYLPDDCPAHGKDSQPEGDACERCGYCDGDGWVPQDVDHTDQDGEYIGSETIQTDCPHCTPQVEEEPTGECLVAMSGPTCMDPNSPPCQHPEMRQVEEAANSEVTVTDEMVERACAAYWDSEERNMSQLPVWWDGGVSESMRDEYRRDMRPALEAALSSTTSPPETPGNAALEALARAFDKPAQMGDLPDETGSGQ